MKSPALQEFVKKIFSDEKMRRQFEADPEKTLSKLSLTEQEKKAVLSSHTRLGLVTGNSQQLEAALEPTGQWSAPTP